MGGRIREANMAGNRSRARVVDVWETSVVESRTHRGFEKRWVEPGGKVVIGSHRSRLFTEDQWNALFVPTGPEWPPIDSEPPCPTRLFTPPGLDPCTPPSHA